MKKKAIRVPKPEKREKELDKKQNKKLNKKQTKEPIDKQPKKQIKKERPNKVSKKGISKKNQFKIELMIAILIALGCSIAGMSNLLWQSNELYPLTSDVMGHMTKVRYISEQMAQGHIPSWFPYWYNGATTTQYYVPLSYYLMVPIYWITNNVMLTYKIFCLGVMTVGGIGVWFFCYKKIGRVCGFIGIIVFCLQPFLLQSLYGAGVIAQGPIFALMPWFLLVILSCAQAPTKLKFALNTILSTLLIFSHAMHAFMVCGCTLVILLLFLLLKKITLKNLIIVGGGIVFAGLITAFWSVVGATGLENPTIPYLLPESALKYTATIHWFIPNDPKGEIYYSIFVSAFSAFSILIYMISALQKRNDSNKRFYGLAAISLTIFTTIFSFGMHMPGYKYLPMASSMVAGRILSFTAVAAAISCAYAMHMIWCMPKVKLLFKSVVLAIIVVVIIGMNPYLAKYRVLSSEKFDSMKDSLDVTNSAFDKGRYEWFGGIDSSETYFPITYDYNTCDGWNIEGSPHNKAIWNHNIAFTIKDYDYIVKQLAFWNVRYLYLYDDYHEAEAILEEKMGFSKRKIEREQYALYVSDKSSSYYLKDSRNAIIISTGSEGIGIMFPNLVQGKSENIGDYTLEELAKYKVVYINEPKIETQKEISELETMVTDLTNLGVTVMIEPIASRNYDIFGVHTVDEPIESIPELSFTKEYPFGLEDSIALENGPMGIVRSLYGLDEVYANFEQKEGAIENAILGSKKVGVGKVYFLGAHLSQYLQSVFIKNFGYDRLDTGAIKNSDEVESIYSSMLSYFGVNEEYMPEVFETVTEDSWNYQGCNFTYDSEEETEVTVSVTYTPRWRAYLDGDEIEVSQRENLITLNLPAGEHKVELHYGVTIYGKIGYLISAFGLFLFVLFLLAWNKSMRLLDKTGKRIVRFLQFEEKATKIPEVIHLEKEEAEDEVAVTLEVEHTPHKADRNPIMVTESTLNNGIKVEIIQLDKNET